MIIQTIPEFLDAVKNEKLSSLDKHNFLQKVTDNFDSYKIDLFVKDINHYLIKFKEQINNERSIAFKSNQENNKESEHVEAILTTTEAYYASALLNIKILGAKMRAIEINRQLNEEEIEEPVNIIEAKIIEENCEEIEPIIDLSKSKCTEKLIYLKELGVLDFLIKKDPFNKSTRKLAQALVPILGENYSTIQPTLNPIISDYDSKNNPYYKSTTQKVDVIREHLVQLGMSFDN